MFLFVISTEENSGRMGRERKTGEIRKWEKTRRRWREKEKTGDRQTGMSEKHAQFCEMHHILDEIYPNSYAFILFNMLYINVTIGS